jgi:hypothetical protein
VFCILVHKLNTLLPSTGVIPGCTQDLLGGERGWVELLDRQNHTSHYGIFGLVAVNMSEGVHTTADHRAVDMLAQAQHKDIGHSEALV